jgi:hypothetical protein
VSHNTRHPLHVLAYALVALALVTYVSYLALYVAHAVHLFQWPYDYDQGEGFELYDAVLYRQGEWPYRDNAVYPYYASNYPPLFHLLIVPLLPLVGVVPAGGRIVSFAATLITAGIIGAIVRREVKGGFVPLLAGLSYLASNYVYQIGPLCRLHATMVMFEALAVLFLAHFEKRRNLVLGLLMLLLAGYTKQMAVFTVAATLSYVFLRDIKTALRAGAALALVTGVIFWGLNVATDGQWWVNIIQANVNEFDYLMTISLFKQWLRLHPVLILLALGYLIYQLYWDRLSIYSLWFLFALATGALSGKWGAGPGYFLTAVAASCVSAGLALGRLQTALARRIQKPWAKPALRGTIALLYLAQAGFILHLPTSGPVFEPLAQVLGVADQRMELGCRTYAYYDTIGYTQLGHWPTPEDYAAGEEIMAYVRAAEGPVLSEEAMFSLLADKPVVTNPTQLRNLYENDLLDAEDLMLRIYHEAFDVIILRAQFYPEPVLGAIWFAYEPVESICMNGFTYQILQPPRLLADQRP